MPREWGVPKGSALGSWKKYGGLLPEFPWHYPCKNHLGHTSTHTGTMVKTKNPKIHLKLLPNIINIPCLN
jgi:hypothetical protein